MLPGFPDAAVWVGIALVIIGLLLIYFGSISRGRNRALAIALGLALLIYVGWLPGERYLHDNPAVAACLDRMWADKSLSCPPGR